MRILRNGILYNGMVQVPVGISPATTTKAKITFKTLHKACELPIKTEKECVTCHASHLGENDLVKGYEFAKGEYVVIEEAELEATDTTRSPYIEITKTIRDLSFDPLWVKQSYWLIPGVAATSYKLLAYGLETEQLVAIGVCRLFNEAPFAVEASGGAMKMHLLYTMPEMVMLDVDVPLLDPLIHEASLVQACKTVRSWQGELDALDLHSEPDRLRKELIAAKVEYGEFEAPVVPELPAAPDDLMEAFRLSMRDAA